MLNKKVRILLSSYNGENYLHEQLESLISQSFKNIEILVRDDGSTDKTCEILHTYEDKYNFINCIYGENLGVVKSFYELLKYNAEDIHYFAFCDQDDYWETEKIEKAIGILEKTTQDKPSLYCSKLHLVDKNKKHLGYSNTFKIKPCLNHAVIENIAVGCTTVINQYARQKVLQKPLNFNSIYMFDWWVYMTVAAFGEIHYDKNSYILYRLHGHNTVGAATGGQISQIINKMNNIIRRPKQTWTNQIIAFGEHYDTELKKDVREKWFFAFTKTLKSSFFIRLIFVSRAPIYREKRIDTILIKILIILRLA